VLRTRAAIVQEPLLRREELHATVEREQEIARENRKRREDEKPRERL
jgi:hypothetical protein